MIAVLFVVVGFLVGLVILFLSFRRPPPAVAETEHFETERFEREPTGRRVRFSDEVRVYEFVRDDDLENKNHETM